MTILTDVLSWGCLLGGVAFALVGAVGYLRLPDVFSRMHAAGIIDTLAALLIIVGLVLQAGFTLVSVKLLFVFAFILVTSPTATHALARAALSGGVRPVTGGAATGTTQGDPPSKG